MRASSAVTDDQRQAASRYLNALLDERKTPGLQYILVDTNRALFRFNGGYADLERRVPVRDSTTFNAYSITKTFTAAAIVKLAIEGKLDFDEPLSTYVDDLPYTQSPTVRQALHHTSGVPNPNPLAWIHRADEHDDFDKQAFVYEVVHRNPELESEPGEKFSYSNIGYLLLGEVVSKASGIPYDRYVSEQIIRPLSLDENHRISFVIDHPATHACGYIRKWNWLNLALGWFVDRKAFLNGSVDGWIRFHNILVNGQAYGGLIGTASGFARYLQAALRVEDPFTQEMLDLMWEIETTRSGKRGRTGMAWVYGDLDGIRYFSHAGGGGGYFCEIRIYPDVKRASVIMTNNTAISNQHHLDRVDRQFFRDSN